MMEGIAKLRCGDPKDIECGFEELKKLRTSGQLCVVAEGIGQFNTGMSDGSCWVGFATVFRFYNVEAAGYDGYNEVEIFSERDWWLKPPDTVVEAICKRLPIL